MQVPNARVINFTKWGYYVEIVMDIRIEKQVDGEETCEAVAECKLVSGIITLIKKQPNNSRQKLIPIECNTMLL